MNEMGREREVTIFELGFPFRYKYFFKKNDNEGVDFLTDVSHCGSREGFLVEIFVGTKIARQ